MSDNKEKYSKTSKKEIELNVVETNKKKEQYDKAKRLEQQYNNKWKQHMVDINEIIKKITPNAEPKIKGSKMEYISEDYHVKADMFAGYLRIFDRKTGQAIKLDKTPGTLDETHFKIKKKKGKGKGELTMYIELIEKRVEPSEDYYFKVIPNDTKGISKRYDISMDDAERFYDKYVIA